MTRKVVIRADVSPWIGTGHLRRCAALGKRLREAGAQVHFLARARDFEWQAIASPGADACVDLDWNATGAADVQQVVEYAGETGADRVILDHGGADEAYQLVLRDAGLRWMQFDGGASMPLWADWVVSMSPAADASAYRPLQRRAQTRLLLGPRYAIVREEFLQPQVREAPPAARRLLFTFGGADDRGACLACLEALRELSAFEISILSGRFNPQASAIRAWLQAHPAVHARLLLDEIDVARRMSEAHIAITAAGTTTFELALLGLPALLIQIADNQRGNAVAWDLLGVAVNLGPLAALDPGTLRRELISLAGDAVRRERMARLGREAVDGRGADRLVQELYPDLKRTA